MANDCAGTKTTTYHSAFKHHLADTLSIAQPYRCQIVKDLLCLWQVGYNKAVIMYRPSQICLYQTKIKIQLGELPILMEENCQILSGICYYSLR